jgi:hypothetical protein
VELAMLTIRRSLTSDRDGSLPFVFYNNTGSPLLLSLTTDAV